MPFRASVRGNEASILPPAPARGLAYAHQSQAPAFPPLARLRERGRGRGLGGKGRQSGLTLVEMIVAIVVGGILVALTSMFVRGQIATYFDVSNRAALADDADTAVRYMAREIAAALPNSVRVSCLPAAPTCTSFFLEFVPIRDAGRYRSETGAGVGNALDFGGASVTTQFDVLGPPVRVEAGSQIVVYNLGEGQAPANVYGANAAVNNRRAPSVTGAALNLVSAAAPFQFPLASPGSRFQVVGQPVSYACNGGMIRRYTGYGFLPLQPTSFASTGSALVEAVTACNFSYVPAVLQRNGLVSIALTLTRNDESVTLQQQIVVNNTP